MIKTLDVAKAALYAIFLNYYGYYVVTGSFIPGGTMLFFGGALLCVGMDVMQQRGVYIGTEFKCWLMYALLSLITTMLVTIDAAGMGFIGDIVKYVQRTVIIMMVAYICEREGSIRFGLRLMAVTAIVLSISVISVTGSIQLKLDITSGANLSANDTGAIMAFGCFAILFAWGKRRKTSLLRAVLKIAAVICCVVVIFLAGSRKSIGAVMIMVVVMLVLCFPDYGRKLSGRQLLILAIVGVAAYWYITKELLPLAEQTNLYDRLYGDNAAGAAASDEGRWRLIMLGLEHFVDSPLVGLGFDGFTAKYRVYTHCTYVEPLACSGIIGLLYLYPYYLIVKKQLYLIFRSRAGSYARLKQKEMFVYLCMFLFVGVGIPYLYKDVPCIILGTFIGHQAISFRELRTTGHLSADY